ncbi:prephenate dehydrogenase [Pseudonocardia acaciae]|uniref:prephenate dehydrogenase n=1 Tax=Pseudonocardia acaciae TaxID=551276 RepID=UPI00056BCBF8|nr:prephenate dehydrogenase [Pseudonocardia acaciae]
MTTRPICVIGLGLIGGSLARAAVTAGRTVWASTASETTAAAARADGYDVAASTEQALERAKAEDALVVLAVPLTAVPDVLRQVRAVAPECRLTDVVSVQAAMRDAVRAHAPEARYVGGHPMAGTEESGWAAGSAGLFQGANWVVAADDGLDPEVWADVAELAWDCGGRVVPAGAEDHDAAVARISHLPHLLAAVLATVAAEDGGELALTLAAGSFADATRVMDTRPELVLAMCEGNRSGLLPAVDDALGRLGAARGSLASTGGLAATINAGHRARELWHQAKSAPETTVPRHTPLADLRALAHTGHVLTGWTPS